MPEYKVLMSFPDKDNSNTVTLFNGSKEIHKISGKEKVRLLVCHTSLDQTCLLRQNLIVSKDMRNSGKTVRTKLV